MNPKEIYNELLKKKIEKSKLFLTPHEGSVSITLDDGELFYVDPTIVCSRSHYFNSLFSGNWVEKESIKNGIPISISEIKSDDMKILLHYIYIDEILPFSNTMTRDEYFEKYFSLVYWANFLGLFQFEEDMSYFSMKYLTIETLFLRWKQSTNYQCFGLKNRIEEYFINNFMIIAEKQGDFFFHCPRKLLQNVFRSGDINASHDEQLELVFEWGRRKLKLKNIQVTDDNLRQYILDLLPPSTLFNKEHKEFLFSMMK
jgi:hypothetical protein